MFEIMGERQQELLQLLLRNKGGLTVEELSLHLGITRNAVRQHLASLENDQLIAKSLTRPSGGRPEQLYVLTERGTEIFPRQYSWFSEMLLEMVEQEVGKEGVSERLNAAGARVAKRLRASAEPLETLPGKVQKLALVMEDLGYDINPQPSSHFRGIPVIEANNCVFHDLAKKQPLVCQFDLALLSTFTDSKILHEECMARGGNVCRFAFESGEEGSEREDTSSLSDLKHWRRQYGKF
jgi:predicted ArsR family transcriptional regulator